MPDYVTLTNEKLSAEIARRLFGMEPHPTLSGLFLNASVGYKGDYSRPTFASDHNAALGRVVPEMRRRGYEFSLVQIGNEMRAVFWSRESHVSLISVAPPGEIPRAICEAALAALDAEQTKGASHPATCSYWNEPYSVCDCGLLLAALDAEGGE